MGAPRLGQEKLWPRTLPEQAARVAELRRLYEVDGLGVIAIARRFGVTHRTVAKRLNAIGAVMRRPGVIGATTCCADSCKLPVWKVRHANNGSLYGRRCRLHWIIFRMEVNQRYNDKTLALGKDEAWLRRMRQLLARVARMNREVSLSLRVGSQPGTTLPSACPRS